MAEDFPSFEDKEQPWKLFWPPKVENFTPQELIDNPWIGLCSGGGNGDPKPDSDPKPWYNWMRKDNDLGEQRPGYVCRRGSQ